MPGPSARRASSRSSTSSSSGISVSVRTAGTTSAWVSGSGSSCCWMRAASSSVTPRWNRAIPSASRTTSRTPIASRQPSSRPASARRRCGGPGPSTAGGSRLASLTSASWADPWAASSGRRSRVASRQRSRNVCRRLSSARPVGRACRKGRSRFCSSPRPRRHWFGSTKLACRSSAS